MAENMGDNRQQEEKNAVVIDGIDVRKARIIQDNLYYYSRTQEYSLYDKNHFEETIRLIYSEYVTLFGFSPLSAGTPLLIVLDPDSKNPNTNLLGDGYRIRFKYRDNDKKGVFSPRTVYEFGHELTHYFYNVKYERQGFMYARWNEEIIAETMAIYMLNRLKDKVYKTSCSMSTYLSWYLTDDYKRKDEEMKSTLQKKELSWEEFEKLSKEVMQEAKAEIRYLYEVFLQHQSDIRHIMNLYDYYNKENKSIDYDKWEQDDTQSDFIHKVRAIQPKLVSGEAE